MKKRYIIIFLIIFYLITNHIFLSNFRFNRNCRKDTKLLKETPNLLFQTYNDKSKIPEEIYQTVKKYAPEYTHIILDDTDGINFLSKYFEPPVLKTFKKLKLGAHKADLLRYCLLYIHGGVYMDISTELLTPLSTIFTDKTILYTVISGFKDHIYQGVICTPPRNPLFLCLIYYIVKTGNPLIYHEFCKDFLYQINKDLKYFVKPGLNISKQGNKYYLLSEECSKNNCSLCNDKCDKYGLCCMIYDKGFPVIKTRRESYPW
jgi:hypothetical protein